MSVIPTRYSDGPGSVVSHDRSAGPESVASKSWIPTILLLVLWAMSRNYAKTFLHFSHAIFLKKGLFLSENLTAWTKKGCSILRMQGLSLLEAAPELSLLVANLSTRVDGRVPDRGEREHC